MKLYSLIFTVALTTSCSPLQYIKEQGNADVFKHATVVEQERRAGAKELAALYRNGDFEDALLLLDQLPLSDFLVREAGWIYLQRAREHELFRGRETYQDCAMIENRLHAAYTHLKAAATLNPADSLSERLLEETEQKREEYRYKRCLTPITPPPQHIPPIFLQ